MSMPFYFRMEKKNSFHVVISPTAYLFCVFPGSRPLGQKEGPELQLEETGFLEEARERQTGGNSLWKSMLTSSHYFSVPLIAAITQSDLAALLQIHPIGSLLSSCKSWVKKKKILVPKYKCSICCSWVISKGWYFQSIFNKHRTITNKHNKSQLERWGISNEPQMHLYISIGLALQEFKCHQLLPVYSYYHKLRKWFFPKMKYSICFWVHIKFSLPHLNLQSNPKSRGYESALCFRILYKAFTSLRLDHQIEVA